MVYRHDEFRFVFFSGEFANLFFVLFEFMYKNSVLERKVGPCMFVMNLFCLNDRLPTKFVEKSNFGNLRFFRYVLQKLVKHFHVVLLILLGKMIV